MSRDPETIVKMGDRSPQGKPILRSLTRAERLEMACTESLRTVGVRPKTAPLTPQELLDPPSCC